MPTILRGIADKAVKDKGHKFMNLYHSLDEGFLRQSFFKIKKRSSPGIDGVAFQDYCKDLSENLISLVDRLKRNAYKAKTIKRFMIPKGNGKLRALGLPCLEDKVLQVGVARLLTPIYESDFLDFSQGYRPNRSAKVASHKLAVNLQKGKFGYVVEADIKGFFDNIDHDWMIKMLEHRINDRKIINLIKKWLKAGILDTNGMTINPATGTPQGGVISPILANVYLHYALDLWFEKIVKPNCSGQATMIRYADDFVCAFQYSKDAVAFFRALEKRLKKFNLELAKEKSGIVRFSRLREDSKTFNFLGFTFRWRLDRSGKRRVFRETAKDKLRTGIQSFKEWIKGVRHLGTRTILKLLKLKYQGYWNYYGVIGNYSKLHEFYRVTVKILLKWLKRRSQRHKLNYDRITKIMSYHRVPSPRITERINYCKCGSELL